MIWQLLLSAILLLIIIKNITIILRYIRVWYINYYLPGPGYFPVLGLLIKLCSLNFNEMLEFTAKITAGKRTTSYIHFGRVNTFLHSYPPDIERAIGNTNHIEKGDEYITIRPWLKEGLLTSGGKKWHQRRKILTPTFHFKILENCLPIMNEHAIKLTEKLLSFNNESVDIENIITLCTLDIISEAAMGIRLNALDNKATDYVSDVKRATKLISVRVTSFWLWIEFLFWLSPSGREFFQVVTRLHNFSEKIIAERKQIFRGNSNPFNGKRRMAFLDCLLDVEMKNPGTFSDSDIREEVDTFMFEGHDTTSTAIIFCLMLLGQYEDVQMRAVEELNDIFGDSKRPATVADLQNMRYLDMVIKETLRLYPSVPLISRSLNKDLILEDGIVIPAPSNLLIIPYLTHRNPTIYEDPESFKPERFNDENSKMRHPFAYMPFSAGPRNCVGQRFAMMELKCVISTILRNCSLESITKKETLKLLPLLVLKPEGPIFIKFASRG